MTKVNGYESGNLRKKMIKKTIFNMFTHQLIDCEDFSQEPDHAGDKVQLGEGYKQVALLHLCQYRWHKPLEQLVQTRNLLLIECRPRQRL